jgi:hypothetical protein
LLSVQAGMTSITTKETSNKYFVFMAMPLLWAFNN